MTRALTSLWVPVLVTIALLARLIVPAGFMPSFENGMVALTICHGAGVKTIMVPADEVPGHDPDSKSNDNSCAFAIPMAADKSADLIFIAVFLAALWLVTLPWTRYASLSGRLARTPANPRAPPFLV